MWTGIQGAFADLSADVRRRYGRDLEQVGGIGISAMMHGYLAFDAAGELLAPFRTWRNTNTDAAAELSDLFDQSIPLRWSISHVYQAVLNGEAHVPQIAHVNTLAGYVHWKLTGEQVLGVGDASGMFPIDAASHDYDATLAAKFDELVAGRLPAPLLSLLPKVLDAGEAAGTLSADGAALLDPSGKLQPGVKFAPPEGDAGTGMVATNSVAPGTGNVSAGTSIFAMVVLEHVLTEPHGELDLVTTPAGDPVAMVHCNNGASELNAWAGLFSDFAKQLGSDAETAKVFSTLFNAALEGAPDGGGLLAYNYLSGEHNVGLEEGRPLFARTPDSELSLANFMRVQLYSMLATLRLGMDVLAQEGLGVASLFGHGGLFKTAGVGQRAMAAALNSAVSVGEVAAEGGAWGMAVLTAFATRENPGTFSDFLTNEVFASVELSTVEPDPSDVAGFNAYLERFQKGFVIETTAVENL